MELSLKPIPWSPKAVAKRLGISIEAANRMSQRQRNIAMHDAEDPGDRRLHGQIDLMLSQMDSKGFRDLNPVPRAKAKPLRPDLRRRLDKLLKFTDTLERERDAKRKRELAARAAKVLDGYEPKPKDPLDIAIAAQLKTQPVRHQAFLKLMYSGWVANNQAYFGGKLKLPIITVVPNTEDSQAYCDINKMPCVIAFCEKTPARRSTRYCLEILLHEQIHQAIAQHAGPKAAWGANLGHHSEFARLCNNIAKARGWKDCYVGPVSDPHSSCHWPHH